MDHPTTPPDGDSFYHESDEPEAYILRAARETSREEHDHIEQTLETFGSSERRRHITTAIVSYGNVHRHIIATVIDVVAEAISHRTNVPVVAVSVYEGDLFDWRKRSHR